MKEIKATAPTREELFEDYKRVVKRLELAESFMSSDAYKVYLAVLENKTND